MNYTIFANHAHVFPETVRADGSIEELRRLMYACGIQKCICFAPFHAQVTGFTDNPNMWLAETLKNSDDLFGFGVVDLHEGVSADSIKAQVKQIAQLGFKGIKLHPAYQKFNVAGEAAFAVYQAAEEAGLFLSFHTGIHWHRILDYKMLLFDEVAYHFPKLRFSMEHLGGYCFFKDGLAVMLNNSKRHTVYAGLTSVSDREENRFWYLNDGQLSDLFWQTGYEQSIFGLDFPYNGIAKTKAAIDRILTMNITEDAKAAILGLNLSRALNISF